MARVLHLFDQRADYESRRMAVVLADRLKNDFAPTGLTIGRGGDLRDVLTAARSLDSFGPDTVLHAWGTRPLIAAALAGCENFIYTPPTHLNRWDIRWLRWLARREMTVVFSRPSQQLSADECDLPHENCRLIPPGLPRTVNARDDSLRRQLGFSSDDFVLLCTGSGSETLSLWTAAILHLLDPTWRLLVWGKGESEDKLRKMAAPLHKPAMLKIESSLEYEDLLPAADVALTQQTGTESPLAAALCMAAGIPVVQLAKPRATAQYLLDLRTNPAFRESLSQSAHSDAVKFFDLDRFVEQYKTLYVEASLGVGREGKLAETL
jgi:hypothetical protein